MIFQQWNFPSKTQAMSWSCTKYLQLNYNKKAFSANGLSCKTTAVGISSVPAALRRSDTGSGGTARTLDQVNGACELEPGIMSWFGSAVLDDSKSLLMTERTVG